MTQVAQRVLTLRPDPDEESAFASGLQLAVLSGGAPSGQKPDGAAMSESGPLLSHSYSRHATWCCKQSLR